MDINEIPLWGTCHCFCGPMLTVLMDRVSLLTILTERLRFLPNSNGGGSSSPSIMSFRLCVRDPKTLLSSHILTYKPFKQECQTTMLSSPFFFKTETDGQTISIILSNRLIRQWNTRAKVGWKFAICTVPCPLIS